jgi:hypothetical protein
MGWLFLVYFKGQGKIEVTAQGTIRVTDAGDAISKIIAAIASLLKSLFKRVHTSYVPGFLMIILGALLLVGSFALAANAADESDGESEPSPTATDSPAATGGS